MNMPKYLLNLLFFFRKYLRDGNRVGLKSFELKNWFKTFSPIDFTLRFVKIWEKNFEQIKSTNLNAKSMDEMNFKLFFWFKTLWTCPVSWERLSFTIYRLHIRVNNFIMQLICTVFFLFNLNATNVNNNSSKLN
jgi:hypothetical protein